MSRQITRFLPLAALVCPLAAAEWVPLFNGRDLTGWTTVLEKMPPGQDPDRHVQVRDGAIHMYPDTDPAATVPFGVIVHEKPFSRFHISLEYRWAGKKFAPRKDAVRDAGLLYHVTAADKVWPDSVEYQIQEGDTGDIVFLPKGGLTWMRPNPDSAPPGQGEPGLLPEDGGIPRDFGGKGFAYIGRFPELDRLQGWNRVEAIVHAGETAEHLINGRTIARISHLREKSGPPAERGLLALQLEGAEILYRDVKIRELPEPLRPERRHLALSAVQWQPARAATLLVRNPTAAPVPAPVVITGRDAHLFTATASADPVPAGGSTEVTVTFSPPASPGRFSAGLRIGDAAGGAFVVLQGIGLAAFEGKNEPALQDIVHALGIPLDVGGKRLELDTKAPVIGQSVLAPAFLAAAAGEIRVTPLARFSPPGITPFGIVHSGSTELLEKGRLADVSKEIPDAHQTLFPPLDGAEAAVSFPAPDRPFAFYMAGHKFVSFTDPGMKSAATIPHTARAWPVTHFQGREMKNAWLIGFEEASNGDYQDALFLVENVTPEG